MCAGTDAYSGSVEEAVTMQKYLQALHETIDYVLGPGRYIAQQGLMTRTREKQLLFQHLLKRPLFTMYLWPNISYSLKEAARRSCLAIYASRHFYIF